MVRWEIFREEILGKDVPADVRNKKKIEFLELKQGSMTVAEYAAKYQELSRFCPLQQCSRGDGFQMLEV